MSTTSLAPERVLRRAEAAPTSQRQDARPSASRPLRSPLYEPVKRTLDIVLSAAGLIVLSPVFALIAIAIRLESSGPVFFGHERLGKGGRVFACLKFRSMRADAHEWLQSDPQLRHRYIKNDFKIPLEHDPRVTRVGRFLRRSSLDELPQLLNVLAGSMSLVGPRPIVQDELRWYPGDEHLLLSVRPGITGEWQVQGRSRIGYPDRADVELNAIAERSLWRDLKILVRSVPAVVTARGSM